MVLVNTLLEFKILRWYLAVWQVCWGGVRGVKFEARSTKNEQRTTVNEQRSTNNGKRTTVNEQR